MISAFGDALLMQVCFVAAAIPIVTILPAFIALQETLRDVYARGESAAPSRFFRHFVTAVRRTWRVALAPPVFALLLGISISFWAAVGGTLGIAMLGVLAVMTGIGTALFVAFVAASTILPATASARRTAWVGWSLLPRRALQFALSIVGLVSWIILAARLPTLLLVGSGLIPAAFIWWVSSPWAGRAAHALRTARRERRAGDASWS